MTLRLALYEPDIPQNTGTMMRMAACLGIGLDVIEPCGFVFSDKQLKRAGMDYLEQAEVTRHTSWRAFSEANERRIVLLSTKASVPYTGFSFQAGDTVMVGRESAGVPDDVFEACPNRVLIPMVQGARSLNVAISAAMVLGEALRQTCDR